MASREYRAIFAGSALAWFGDNAARAAVTALVLQRTGSIGASAATFAISFLPWLGVGPILAAIAERHSYRRVMIICDVLRMVLMALVAVPNTPVIALIGLLFATALLNPPFEAARSALLPQILEGDRYIVGLTTQKTVAQAAQIFGYLFGATIATFDARLAVLLNAATFGLSAAFVTLGVRARPPALAADRRSNILRETAEGFELVFRRHVLRAIALVTFLSSFFSVLPEGLAAGWAAHLTSDGSNRGWYQGVIMISFPVGYVLGGLVIGRYTAPTRRVKFVQPFAVLSSLVLVPSLLDPGLALLSVMNAICGFAIAGMLPALNGLFVQALPDEFRARAFGVMQGGLQLLQGLAIVIGGVLSDWIQLPLVVGAWASVGVVVMILLAVRFPDQRDFDNAIAAAALANAGGAGTGGAGSSGVGAGSPGVPDAPEAPETPGERWAQDDRDTARADFPPPAAYPDPPGQRAYTDLAGQSAYPDPPGQRAYADLPDQAVRHSPPAPLVNDGEAWRPPAPRPYTSGSVYGSDGGGLPSVVRDELPADEPSIDFPPEARAPRVLSVPESQPGRHRRY